MRRHVLLLAGIALSSLLFSPSLFGQVAISLKTDSSNYLQYQPVNVVLSMRNLSAHPLAFGDSKNLKGSLRFEIYDGAGNLVPLRNEETPPMLGVILQPGVPQTMTFNVSAYYNLNAKGRYSLKAMLSHPMLPAEYESSTMSTFSVSDGQEIWTRSIGMPDYMGNKELKSIPARDYKIVSIFDGKTTSYILVVEDKERVYAVKRVGFDMGGNLLPKCEIDSLSRLNLLIAASPKVFVCYVYGPEGKLESSKVFIKTQTTPSLVVNQKDGSVQVLGGRLARKDTDYQELKELPFLGQASESKVADEEEP